MGLLNNGFEAIPQEKRQPVDDAQFSQLFNSLYSNYQNQDSIDRQSTWAAQRQQDAYLNNKSEWDKILQSGGDLPSTSKPFSLDPAEQPTLEKNWNDKWSTPFKVEDGKDANGNPIFNQMNVRPLKTYDENNQFQMTPDYYSGIKKIYEQYGPQVLPYLFS